jgi:putative membrane protein
MPDHQPYGRFSADDLILRDELAIDRTLLANERTLLAYLRSGVALVIAGATMIHFSEQGWFYLVGAVCIPAGVAVTVLGAVRYRRMRETVGRIRRQLRRSPG